jgi:hypothetical protein
VYLKIKKKNNTKEKSSRTESTQKEERLSAFWVLYGWRS